MRKVYYVGYYDTVDSKQSREYFLSATNFMDYIADTMCSEGFEVEIVSMSDSTATHPEKGGYRKIGENKYLKFFFSFGKKNQFLRRFDIHFLRFQMFLYLLFHIKGDSIVLVYHSLNYARVLTWLKKVRNYKCVSHFCEVYGEVNGKLPKQLLDHEFDLINVSDAFIFSNKYLEKIYNKRNCAYVLAHGVYKTPQHIYEKNFNDGKIHVVYAGTLDPHKGGAIAAVAAAEYLTQNYNVHILGFGSEDQILQLKKQIEDVKTRSHASVTYDGLLKGEKFTEFLSKCHIGLATQIPDASFCKSSFPSKVLTYLSQGLEVVSSRYDAVECSEVGKSLHYYNGQDPKEIANCIMKIDLSVKHKNVLDELDKNFHVSIRKLLSSL